MKNNINKILCIFDNPVLEENFQKEEWHKLMPYKSVVIVLGTIVPFVGVITALYYKVYTNFLMDLVFTIVGISAFFFNDIDKIRKIAPVVVILAFAVILPLNSIYNFDIDMHRAVTLPIMPILVSLIILRLMPLTFAIALLTSFIAFFTFLYLQDHKQIFSGEYLAFFIPFFILVFDKRRSEINKRVEFSQKETIQNTKKLMHETLNRYFGETLSNKILSEEGNLKGEIKWVSISFTDIASYSTIIENMSPEVAVKLLNEYFTKMHDVIEKHGGQILNYIGDAIMVVFGAPNQLDDHEVKALECAIEMRESLEQLNKDWDDREASRYWKNHGIKKISVRTGIHTGSVIAGNIGSERMLQYSTIGDVVNVAARLEQANKEFETDICVSEEIYINLTKSLHEKAIFVGEVTLKGRNAPSKVYGI